MGLGGRPKNPVWEHFHAVDVGGKTLAKCVYCGYQLSNKAARMKAHQEKCSNNRAQSTKKPRSAQNKNPVTAESLETQVKEEHEEEEEEEEETRTVSESSIDPTQHNREDQDKVSSAATGGHEAESSTQGDFEVPRIKEEPLDDDLPRENVSLFPEPPSVFTEPHSVFENTRLERYDGHDVFITSKDTFGKMVFQLSQPGNLILSSIQAMRRDGILTDVTLVANNGRVNAHQIVLAAYSRKFLTTLRSSGHSSDSHFTLMVPAGLSVVTTVLDFLYEGMIKISEENYEDLKGIADCLGIDLLVEYCNVYRTEKDEANQLVRQSPGPKLSDAASSRKRKLNEPVATPTFVTDPGVPDLLHDIKQEDDDVPSTKKTNPLSGIDNVSSTASNLSASSDIKISPAETQSNSESQIPTSPYPQAAAGSAPVPILLTQNVFGTLPTKSGNALTLISPEPSKTVNAPIVIQPTPSSSSSSPHSWSSTAKVIETSVPTAVSGDHSQGVKAAKITKLQPQAGASATALPLGTIVAPAATPTAGNLLPTYTVLPQGTHPGVQAVSGNSVILSNIPAVDSQGNTIVLLRPSQTFTVSKPKTTDKSSNGGTTKSKQ